MPAPRYNRVPSIFWRETRKQRWSHDERDLGLFLLTSEHRTTEGLFYLPKPFAVHELGWDAERLEVPWKALVDRDFMRYDEVAECVLLVGALEVQRPDNTNQILGALKCLRELPETPLFGDLIALADQHAQAFAKALRKEFG